MIFSMERKSGFWISVFGYRAIVGSPVVLLVAMNELLQVSHSIALSQLCDVGISMLGGG